MRRAAGSKARGWRMLLLDVVVMIVSLLSAWGIRSTFRNLFFDLDRLLFILPYFIFTRVIVNLVFEDYRLSFANFQSRDLVRILAHNAIPTALFLALRYLTLYAPVRLPTSIILAEYVLTFAGMVFVRMAVLTAAGRRLRADEVQRARRVFFYGDFKELSEEQASEVFGGNLGIEVVSIFSPDRLAWNLDHRGIRVVGGLVELERAARVNDGIAALVAVQPRRREQALSLLSLCRNYSLSLYVLCEGGLLPVRHGPELLDGLFVGGSISPEVLSKLAGSPIAVLGAESTLADRIRRLWSQQAQGRAESRSLLGHPADLGDPGVVFDLRYAALWEHGLLRDSSLEEFLDVLEREVSRPTSRTHGPRVVVPLPAVGAKDAIRLLAGRHRAVLLLIEPFSHGGRWTADAPSSAWIEGSLPAAAGLLKVAAVDPGQGGVYYFRSSEAVSASEFLAPLDPGPVRAFTSREAPHDLLAELKQACTLVETEYFQLWRLGRRETDT